MTLAKNTKRTRNLGQTEPGLYALYAIRPGNGSGLYSLVPGRASAAEDDCFRIALVD